MKPINRRRFLALSAATAASLKPSNLIAQTPTTATLTLHPDKPGPTIPQNFIGLSYETQQLSDPTFFSPANTGLIAQMKALAPHGVLRIGGNTSDVGWWKPTADTQPPPMDNMHTTGRAGEPTAKLAYSIAPQSIVNLRRFLDATGWTCIFGINLGTNTPARAAEEAVFVAKTLGEKLEYFQIGNEPDLFGRHMRDPKTWTADRYFDEWISLANAIRFRVPNARFGLPDTAGEPEWYAKVVDRLLAMHDDNCPCTRNPTAACSCAEPLSKIPPHIAGLSHHYYFTGPPSNPKATISRLLQPDPRVLRLAEDIRTAAARLDTPAAPMPYRMTEGNTCYMGGRPGMSDVFASALWSADYLLLLASLGYAGVNLHGGDGQMVANSLGGTLPGDAIVIAEHGDPATHPHPYYTPIAHIGSQYIAEPVSYGMKFAGMFAGATMIPVDFNPGSVNATAYAAKYPNGKFVVAVINKDPSQSLNINCNIVLQTDQSLSAKSLTDRAVYFGFAFAPRGGFAPPSSAVIFHQVG